MRTSRSALVNAEDHGGPPLRARAGAPSALSLGRTSIVRTFDPPERKWAAGTVYLRGQGAGLVRAVHGLDALPPEVTSLVVDSRLPRAGQPSSGSYEGDGYITIRHPDTEVVTAALRQIVSTVRVELG